MVTLALTKAPNGLLIEKSQVPSTCDCAQITDEANVISTIVITFLIMTNSPNQLKYTTVGAPSIH
jgi:hypothetical protein